MVAATRLLFDERGLQDAPMEDIARAVGINRALIYRYFSSKEELFVLTLTSYLAELAERLDEIPKGSDPIVRLEDGWRRYTDYCLEHPAFLDCGLSLMRRPAAELRETISDAVWIRLGQSMAACLDKLSKILALGAQQGRLQGQRSRLHGKPPLHPDARHDAPGAYRSGHTPRSRWTRAIRDSGPASPRGLHR